MSATLPLRNPAPARPSRTTKPVARPRLVVVAGPHRTVARGPFLLLVGGLMLGGLLVLLMLHTLAAQDAFRQTTLQQRLSTLTDTEQQLEQQVQTDSAPSALEARARALGMVPSTITSYHRRANGRTVAHQAPITVVAPVAPVAPASTTTTPASTTTTPASSPTTAASTKPTTPAKAPASQSHTGKSRR